MKHILRADLEDGLSKYNWLRIGSSHSCTSTGSLDVEDLNLYRVIPGAWRSRCQTNKALQNVQLGSNNYSKNAATLRESYADYFCAGGSVPRQDKMIH